MDLEQILKKAAEVHASDIFMVSGLPLTYKINNRIVREDEIRLMPEDTEQLILAMYHFAGERDSEHMLETGDDDFSFSLVGISRFRVNVYRQRGSLSAVIRVVAFELPDPRGLGIPEIVLDLGDRTRGLILVTGAAGSGKSTTLACIIDRINKTRNTHVITLEDPIEYLHRHEKSIISQREIATDTESYMVALRASLRQAPDVILLGEMRDYETMGVAMTAAETGHLVISTLHTMGVVNTIDRIIDAFPPNQQGQIRVQLSMVLQAVVSQQLIPTVDGTVAPVFEVMMVNPAIRNMIRESKIHQIENVVSSSQSEGMISMDASLMALFQEGRITRQDAIMYSISPELMERKLGPNSR